MVNIKSNCKLPKESVIKKANTTTFWHVAKSNLKNDVPKGFFVKQDKFDSNKVFDNLKSFLDNGIMPTGKGYGGQQDGFYVFNHKHFAYHYFYNRLTQYKNKEHPKEIKNYAGEALFVGITINDNELSYPQWQFDLEGCDVLNSLLFKHKDLIYNITLNHKNGAEIIQFQENADATADNFLINKITKTQDSESTETIHIGNRNQRYTNIFQELFDKLCKNETFKQDYNSLLRKCADDYLNVTQIKYCGAKHLPVDEILYIKKDANGNMIETPLYSSNICNVCKDKFVCPFITLKTAKEKS